MPAPTHTCSQVLTILMIYRRDTAREHLAIVPRRVSNSYTHTNAKTQTQAQAQAQAQTQTQTQTQAQTQAQTSGGRAGRFGFTQFGLTRFGR